MDISALKALNEERHARRAAVLVTDLEERQRESWSARTSSQAAS